MATATPLHRPTLLPRGDKQQSSGQRGDCGEPTRTVNKGCFELVNGPAIEADHA
jgi:hypothetical protein